MRSLNMRKIKPLISLFILQFSIFFINAESKNWTGFRGEGNSKTTLKKLPLRWTQNDGILWKVDLSGFGQSSPVIWENHVYVTSTGGKNKESLFLDCYDLNSGKKFWSQRIESTEKVKEVTNMISQGAPTPVTGRDGVYVFFESGDLVAFNHDGKNLWNRKLTKEFGEFKGGHGVGSSLVAVPNGLILLVDHEGPSYLLCLDRKDGKTRWKTSRDPRVSWTTPLYLKHDSEEQIVISSNGLIDCYRLKDGKKIWWFDDIQRNTVASPSTDGNIIVAGSSYPKQSLAIKLGGKGDISQTHLEWRAKSVTCSFASPLLFKNVAYFINRSGTLQAQSIKDGSQLWEYKLPDGCWASPLGANDKVYLFCKNGKSIIIEASAEKVKVLSENEIFVAEGDKVYGYGVADEKFLLRTGKELICVGD
ncbi:MAG: hypothetical protein CMP45_01275 [Rickettsiales bacterium]|nr:hypothetical protein [Rickettsiales bacterium]